MTAPIWMAFPPEVHSTLLSSGPGPGPLLAAAGVWSSMSTEYGEAADELTALLGGVQAGAWQGPSAAQYVAAHAPYLSWLLDSAAKSTTAASLHETAAAAYTTALAVMPTMPELAANHTIHATLLATNFFGINTIPIAVNEADYARMWVQAAATMTTYQAVSESALLAVPETTPAPQIVSTGGDAATTASDTVTTQAQAATATKTYPSWMDQLTAWLQKYTSTFAWPVSKELNPGGWPFPPVPWVNSLASFFGQLGLSPALSQALGWAIFHTLMIFWPFITPLIQLAVVAVPVMMVAAAAVGAAAAGGATAIAVGTAVPLSIQPVPAPAVAPAPVPAPAPAASASVPTSASSSAAAPSTATSAPASSGGGPVGGGPGVGFGPTSTTGIGAGLSDALYAVGLSGLSARGSASSRARRKSEEPADDDADAPAAAAAASAKGRLKARRRRGATAKDKAYRYEFMDLEDDPAPSDEPAATADGRAAGALGFAGAATRSEAAQAAGLATLDGDGWSDRPAVPMLPSSWNRD
ncbi:PPE family protein [Mycobacterium rhizamassiliense]|uniref:PPE family protein n=1 Tax=Mycobacterium rhizamassiliense TaxID=1841860 RepID=A0A2U3NXZ7_9MYCO|nr:PPE domain-containing protein [Mycobacterium rhizamassiliense]SPM36396.1 PPE family protein [Mycobacterium rhizamassiliense]